MVIFLTEVIYRLEYNLHELHNLKIVTLTLACYLNLHLDAPPRLLQSFSYRYGVLAVNFLISAIIFWKNTQWCTGGQFCHGKIPSRLHSGATNTKLCTGFPVIFLHSSMASTFMITSRTNAAFDCGSFLFVLPSSAVCKTHSGRKSISRGPLNDI